MKFYTFKNSRWFYIGLPILCILFGVLFGVGNLIGGAVNQTYHPVIPTENLLLWAKINAGLAGTGLASLIVMAIFKFGFRSPRRASVLVFSLGLWLLGASWLVLTAAPGEDAYKRTFEGQRFAIPWGRVTGEMTSRGNPLGRWDKVSEIGFRYCVHPFDITGGIKACDRPASFLAGTENLTGNGYLHINNSIDRDGRNRWTYFEEQQLKLKRQDVHSLRTSTSSSSSTSDKPWERIVAIEQPDIGGMRAFKRETYYSSDDRIYLFSKTDPSGNAVHHAECGKGIRNGKVVDESYVCTHFVRDDRKAWLFDLRLDETEKAMGRLSQLQAALDGYKIAP